MFCIIIFYGVINEAFDCTLDASLNGAENKSHEILHFLTANHFPSALSHQSTVVNYKHSPSIACSLTFIKIFPYNHLFFLHKNCISMMCM